MPRKSFARLPPENIENIASHLAADNLPGLASFLLVNKRCYTCALPSIKSTIFHTVEISPGVIEELPRQVKRLEEKLERANSFRYVRRLEIHDNPNFDDDFTPYAEYEWRPGGISDLEFCKCSKYSRFRHRKCQDDAEDSYRPVSSSDRWNPGPVSFRRQFHFPDRNFSEEQAWALMARLIERLPELEDLLYRRSSQFPPLLLEALHRARPKCRLHLDLFALSSLRGSKTDPHGFQIVTSPSLHSVCLSYAHITRREADRYPGPELPHCEKSALLRTVALAPNLKKVYIRREDSSGNLRRPWQQFTQEDGNRRLSLGTLQELWICDKLGPLTGATLFEWAKYTDFAFLENLDLDARVENEALESWSTSLSFPSLKKIVLRIQPDWKVRRQTSEYYDAAQSFLQSLPPLTDLSVQGWHSLVSVGSIARRHGPRLRRLALDSLPWQFCTEDDIIQIGRNCPLLRELTVALPRSQGDAGEVARYRALGTVRNLRHLHLSLDVSDMDLRGSDDTSYDERPETPSDPSFDNDFDNQFSEENLGRAYRSRNGHARRVIINSVVDKSLACAIFQTISSPISPQWPPLERLFISVRGYSTDCMAIDDFRRLVSKFSSRWRVDRDLPSNPHNQLVATELPEGLVHRLYKERREHLPLWLEDIFYRIWPKETGKQERKVTKKLRAKRMKEREASPSTWWDDWRSFPLATDS
ncbi:hypothetical protein PHISP_00531 [Aspergillus sp. HF37]|nr:hypothetical protein PHISP_00531 [Aspergillus sp. HF37]